MITCQELIENEKIWKIRVTKGTKAIPEGIYQLYVRSNMEWKYISYKTAADRLNKGKAEIIKEDLILVTWFDYSKDELITKEITEDQLAWLHLTPHTEVERIEKGAK